MVPRGVAKRYATALFNAALKANLVEDVRSETRGFHDILQGNQKFRNFLLSPQILTSNKKSLLNTTLKDQASDLFLRFLILLIDKKRFFFIEEIIHAYEYQYEKHKGIIEVRVITAVPLDETMQQKFRSKLSSETGKTIRLVPETDPSIIAGAIVVMEDKVIDGSVRHKMEKLRRQLEEIRVSYISG